MTDNGKLFLQLMEKAPASVQLATECLLCVGAEGKSAADLQDFIRVLGLREHTKGEYKRAIKHLREYQDIVDRGRHWAYFEETISFIRRDLMAHVLAYRKLSPTQRVEVDALVDQLYSEEQEATAT